MDSMDILAIFQNAAYELMIELQNNLDVWMASLDMRKAFDRIEFRLLFDALQYQEARIRLMPSLSTLICLNQTFLDKSLDNIIFEWVLFDLSP